MGSDGVCTLTVLDEGVRKHIACRKGETIYSVLNSDGQFALPTPCGGKGTCGKCKVRLTSGDVSPLSSQERKKLSDGEINANVRLACMTAIHGDTTIALEYRNRNAQILTEGADYGDLKIDPPLKKMYLELRVPSLEDQRDDARRVLEAMGYPESYIPHTIQKRLTKDLREAEFRVTVVHRGSSVLAIEKGDTQSVQYGIGVDIGTTTVVAYLVDLAKGKRLGAASGLNAQKAFGDDVISRIQYANQHPGGLEVLRKRIIDQIQELVESLATSHGIALKDIYSIVLVGNTTMMHLAAGYEPFHISVAPFIPGVTGKLVLPASDLGFSLAECALAFLVPSVAAYVGADIVSGILSCGMADKEELALFIDIGTNGEIAFGNKEKIYTCSTAAGPAFEGAHIKYGVGGIAGAINTVKMSDCEVTYTTILDKAPLGICGSGIVDAVAGLLRSGIVDETGRIVDKEELKTECTKRLYGRVRRADDSYEFVIAEAEDTEQKQPITIQQRDIRELQLAKASIAAGIATLVKRAGKTYADVDVVYLAGGFGSYIDKRSAVTLGLIPAELEKKIKVLGNAAGTGAVMVSLSVSCFEACDIIQRKTEYLELSSTPEFMDAYIAHMAFPDQRNDHS